MEKETITTKVDEEDDIDFAVEAKEEIAADEYDGENEAAQGMIKCSR